MGSQREKKTARAVILGLEHARSVAVVRSLGRAGIPVVGLDHLPYAPGFRSRYIKTKALISRDWELSLKLLGSLGQDGGGLLIPTNDHYLILVAKNFDRLSRYFTMTTPPWQVLETLMDKPQCYGLAREVGVQTARFFVPGDVSEMNRIIRDLDFRDHAYVLKTEPSSYGPADSQTGRYTIAAGPDAATMEIRCLEITSRTGMLPMIQEVVPGDTDTCIGVSMVVDRNHEPVVWYCVRRLKLYPYSIKGQCAHPYELGANIYCESTHDDEAVDAARSLVRRARYYGMITVEFRRDSTDGSLKLIKADPRPVRATSLSTALGLDLPTTLYHVFTDGQLNPPQSYPDGVAWLWLAPYIKTLWKNRLHSPIRRELFALLRDFRRVKAFGMLSLRDPLPFLLEVNRGAFVPLKSKLIRALKVTREGPESQQSSRAARMG